MDGLSLLEWLNYNLGKYIYSKMPSTLTEVYLLPHIHIPLCAKTSDLPAPANMHLLPVLPFLSFLVGFPFIRVSQRPITSMSGRSIVDVCVALNTEPAALDLL